MKTYAVPAYVIDVLMADLVGHDRKPAAFLVYLHLLCRAETRLSATVPISLQGLAVETGLAKSTVQNAIRHLKQRQLIDASVASTPANPMRRVLKPWDR